MKFLSDIHFIRAPFQEMKKFFRYLYLHKKFGEYEKIYASIAGFKFQIHIMLHAQPISYLLYHAAGWDKVKYEEPARTLY